MAKDHFGRCLYCGTGMSASNEDALLNKLDAHERNCDDNPANQIP